MTSYSALGEQSTNEFYIEGSIIFTTEEISLEQQGKELKSPYCLDLISDAPFTQLCCRKVLVIVVEDKKQFHKCLRDLLGQTLEFASRLSLAMPFIPLGLGPCLPGVRPGSNRT